MSVRELARRVVRDVRRVHDDVQVLAELRQIERTDKGGVACPVEAVRIDMRLSCAPAVDA